MAPPPLPLVGFLRRPPDDRFGQWAGNREAEVALPKGHRFSFRQVTEDQLFQLLLIEGDAEEMKSSAATRVGVKALHIVGGEVIEIVAVRVVLLDDDSL